MAQLIQSPKINLATLLLAVLLVSSSALQAEKMLGTDAHNIHYNAFNSSMLTPEIATLYGIERSSSLGVINISVLNKADRAVTAFIDGSAKNPLSQITTLKFNKVTEENAIYYIATFNFADKEHLTFNIVVVPEGEKQLTKLSFSQQFFVE